MCWKKDRHRAVAVDIFFTTYISMAVAVDIVITTYISMAVA